jgi:RND family efflux transporter MFP subunit
MALFSMPRWPLAGVGIVLLSACAVGFVYFKVDKIRDHADPERARAKGLPIPVRTVMVSESEAKEPIGATAITNGSQIASIQIGASRGFNWVVSDIRLKAVNVHNGSEVHKGQTLFVVDDTSFLEIIKQGKAELEAAKAEVAYLKEAISYNEKIRKLELASAQSELHFRTQDEQARHSEYDTIRRLQQTKAATDFQLFDILSKYEKAVFDKAEAEKRLEKAKDAQTVGILHDKAEYDKALARLEKVRVDLVLAQRDLERGNIRTPIDGFVNTLTVVPGAEVQVAQVLTQVLRLDPIFVVMDFPQERIDDVSIGQEAEVVLDSMPKETFHGKVTRILPQVNPQLRILPVTVEVSNPQNRIKADVSGYVRVWKNKKTTAIPAAAVIQQGSRAIVFCVKDGQAKIREVQPGNLVKVGEVEVRGLKPGDEVVIFNQYYLQENDPVDTDWRKWARRD